MSKLFNSINQGKKVAIGMVQLEPLPGASTYQGTKLADLIKDSIYEAKVLEGAGFDALMIQNLGDIPVDNSVTVTQLAWMSRVVFEVTQAVKIPIGLNFLENDAEAIISVASAADLDFVRLKVFVGVMVTPFGLHKGNAFKANKIRNFLGAQNIGMFADVHDRTGIPLGGRDIAPDIREAVDLGHADGLVLTGSNFIESMEFIKLARTKYPALPLVLGGGSNESNLSEVLTHASGVFVSSTLKDSACPFGRINPKKAASFIKALKSNL